MMSEPARYDALLGVVGYERRSAFIPTVLGAQATRVELAAFPDTHVGHYEVNLSEAHARGDTISTPAEAEFMKWCETVSRASGDGQRTRLLIDISSMTRRRMAQLIEALETLGNSEPFECDFAYAPATYHVPDEYTAIDDVGPVTALFAGWVPSVGLPSVALLGLGHEQERAVGSLEYLDAADAWAFVPAGEDARWREDLNRQNKSLFELLDPSRFLSYEVDSPLDMLHRLEWLVDSILPDARPVALPFGPKLFALVCMLVSRRKQPEVAVWRVVSHPSPKPEPVRPNGKVVRLSTRFSGTWHALEQRVDHYDVPIDAPATLQSPATD